MTSLVLSEYEPESPTRSEYVDLPSLSYIGAAMGVRSDDGIRQYFHTPLIGAPSSSQDYDRFT